jgi:hypothetical protein
VSSDWLAINISYKDNDSMVKPEEREIYEDAIDIYIDLVKSQETSAYLENANQCLHMLEYFEEFEKCKELISIFPHLKYKNG